VKKGFTLIELAIVLVVLSILLALGIPALIRSMRMEKLNEYSYSVFHDLEKTREIALKGFKASFKCLSNHSYEITKFFYNGTSVTVKKQTLPEAIITCNISGKEVVFYNNGLPDRAGNIVVSYYGESEKIIIDNVNGEIKLQ